MKRIAMVGTGYVGLVTGTCFAETGNKVVCLDIDEQKIETLKDGRVPFYEPGLSDLIKRNVKEGRLSFSTDVKAGIQESDLIFIAVGTPSGEDGSADLSHVMAVAKTIADSMNDYKIVVVKSTVPVGTADEIRELIMHRTSHCFDVVSNPEFLKEGDAVNDFLKPDRVVVGTYSTEPHAEMTSLYSPFVRNENPILFMDNRSAELTKYASNAMLATRISFMNELANLCEAIGADVDPVRRGMGYDKRIGPSFLFPGIGYGGSCFPKDVRELLVTANKYGVDLGVVEEAHATNEIQKYLLVDKIDDRFPDGLDDMTVAVWGLSFKPRTDDMREAPSVMVIESLLNLDANIRVHDPEAMGNAREIFGDSVSYADDAMSCVDGADVLLVLTEWNEYRKPDFERVHSIMRSPVVFDGRNVYDPQTMRDLGFEYHCIGRPT